MHVARARLGRGRSRVINSQVVRARRTESETASIGQEVWIAESMPCGSLNSPPLDMNEAAIRNADLISGAGEGRPLPPLMTGGGHIAAGRIDKRWDDARRALGAEPALLSYVGLRWRSIYRS